MKNNPYSNILKATSVLGGVQVFNILVALLRGKFIAVLLGPIGMGFVSLLTTTLSLVTGITNFGLGTSAVKNVAASSSDDRPNTLGKTVYVLKRLVWFTGLLGLIVTFIFARYLSRITFDNTNYTNSFRVAAASLLFTQLALGNNTILQGLRRIKKLAKANLWGGGLGLLISLPLYYFLGLKGIVPGIITASICLLITSWWFASTEKIVSEKTDRLTFFKEGFGMLKMGFLINLGNLITLGSAYLVRLYINHRGGIAEVGFYAAGFSIVRTYVGMVFTSMASDYFPRLAAVSTNNTKCEKEVNQQTEIAILILSPILIIFLVFINQGITILYSNEFLQMVDMTRWAAMGIFFQTLSWSLGYIILAKGSATAYFWNELIANVYLVGLNLAGYYFYGLTGLGISFLLAYILHFIQMSFFCGKKYEIRLRLPILMIFGVQFLLAAICLIFTYFTSGVTFYAVGVVLVLLTSLYSWIELNKRISLKAIFARHIQK